MSARRTALAVLAVLAAAVVAAPAAAQEGTRAVETSAGGTGALVITWVGDPARGCAERGVCDVAGAIALPLAPVGGTADLEVGTDRFDLSEESLSLGSGQAVVRVRRGPAGDPAGVCTERLGGTELQLGLARSGGRRLVLGGDPFTVSEGLGAGRCAGPRPADVAPALPSIPLPRLRRLGTTRLDLRGRAAFAAGPFRGEVASTAVVAVRRRSVRAPRFLRESGVMRGERAGRGRPVRRVRVVRLEALYDVTAAEGALTADLLPAPAPGCRLLDACDLTGRVTLAPALPAAPVRLRLVAEGPAARVAGRTDRAAFAALAAGRLDARLEPVEDSDLTGLPARVRAAVGRTGPTCTDERDVALPGPYGRGRGRDLVVELGARSGGENDDVLRTRCAGPGRADLVTGAAPLATGRMPLSALGAMSTALRVAATRARPGALPVRSGGEVVLTLRRASASVATGVSFTEDAGR